MVAGTLGVRPTVIESSTIDNDRILPRPPCEKVYEVDGIATHAPGGTLDLDGQGAGAYPVANLPKPWCGSGPCVDPGACWITDCGRDPIEAIVTLGKDLLEQP